VKDTNETQETPKAKEEQKKNSEIEEEMRSNGINFCGMGNDITSSIGNASITTTNNTYNLQNCQVAQIVV
jgi:hypothetical protein